MQTYPETDPRHHTQKIQTRLEALIEHLRQDIQKVNENALTVAGKEYHVSHIKDPAFLPWEELGVDIAFECTCVFTKRADL